MCIVWCSVVACMDVARGAEATDWVPTSDTGISCRSHPCSNSFCLVGSLDLLCVFVSFVFAFVSAAGIGPSAGRSLRPLQWLGGVALGGGGGGGIGSDAAGDSIEPD